MVRLDLLITQALEFLPGSAGRDGREIILRQLHSTISSYLFHMRYVIIVLCYKVTKNLRD